MKLAMLFQIFVLFSSCESFNFGRKMFRKHHGIAHPEPGNKMRRRSPDSEPHFDKLAWRVTKLHEAVGLANRHGPNLDHHYIAVTFKKYMSKFD